MAYPTRYLTHKKMLEEYESNKIFVSAFDEMEKLILEIKEKLFRGEKLKSYYERIYGQYLLEMEIYNTSIEVSMRDTMYENHQKKAFYVIHVCYSFDKKTFKQKWIQFPCASYWKNKLYSYDLDSLSKGKTILNDVSYLAYLMQNKELIPKEKKVTPQKETTEKEKMISDLKSCEIIADRLLVDEEMRTIFYTLLSSLVERVEDFDKIDSLEDEHEIQRMVSDEIKWILVLYDKLDEIKKQQNKARYIKLLSGMNERVKRTFKKDEENVDYELEKQFQLLENRYNEKQPQF